MEILKFLEVQRAKLQSSAEQNRFGLHSYMPQANIDNVVSKTASRTVRVEERTTTLLSPLFESGSKAKTQVTRTTLIGILGQEHVYRQRHTVCPGQEAQHHRGDSERPSYRQCYVYVNESEGDGRQQHMLISFIRPLTRHLQTS